TLTCDSTTVPPSFVYNDSRTPEIYALSLHDALPICRVVARLNAVEGVTCHMPEGTYVAFPDVSALGMEPDRLAEVLRDRYRVARSEEHTSELQSRGHLVCRLLLEKKKGNGSRNACLA